MKKLNWNLLSQLEVPLRIVNIKKVYKAEFNKRFIARIHNGFFLRFLNLPKDIKTLRVYLNILLSDGSMCVKSCLLDEHIQNRYVQFDGYKKGEILMMQFKLTSEQKIENGFNFVLEEA
ncbi:MAG: hypothetical protein H7329_16185 [Opitutaceae bacterium]|nr:hypothetical protein [Cytophagales bacterium]